MPLLSESATLLLDGRTEVWLTERLDRRVLAVQRAADYLDCAPEQLTLEHDSAGRPSLAHNGVAIPLHASLSSSDGVAAVAFSLVRSVGVDVQRIPPIEQIDDMLLRRTLHPSELANFERDLRPLPLRFAACWTRKEAVLKAMGTGLGIEPSSILLPPLHLDSSQPFNLSQLSVTLRLTTWVVSPTHVASVCTPDPGLLIR